MISSTHPGECPTEIRDPLNWTRLGPLSEGKNLDLTRGWTRPDPCPGLSQKSHVRSYRINGALVLSGGFRLGPGGTGPPNLAQAPQIFGWFRSALFLLEGF